jgi:glutamate-1-semialdehyde 2,1-aminomutase
MGRCRAGSNDCLDPIAMTTVLAGSLALAAVLVGAWLIRSRLRLTLAKHPSLQGHPRWARRIARLLPDFEYDDAQFFRCDDAPAEIERRRRAAYERLSKDLAMRSSETAAMARDLEGGVSDVAFTNRYRVPFPFRRRVREAFPQTLFAVATDGPCVRDRDGQWHYDLSGSYGVNVFGHAFYHDCLRDGFSRVEGLGLFLGAYHPLVGDNVQRLRRLSGLDEVSFHMSGTEAVMQAVRMARYHTERSHVVRFSGAYHGWWDGVQPGVGNQREVNDVYTLRDMDDRTLRVLETRNDIACVLINPLQALHPNASAPGDATLVASDRNCHYDPTAYTQWLTDLREVCARRGIVLIFDEVFSGFRLALGGAQEYFDVQADLVTYGKTLGGGLPVGVLCGRSDLMKRYRDDRPGDICFARGTFNAHPTVMGCMNAFLERIDAPEFRATYPRLRDQWADRAQRLNTALEHRDLPVRIAPMVSVWSVIYTRPSRYNWMFQLYLRSHGLHLSWTGTGRLIFSHDYDDSAFAAVMDRFVEAAQNMAADGWWWQTGLSNKQMRRRLLADALRSRLRRDGREAG